MGVNLLVPQGRETEQTSCCLQMDWCQNYESNEIEAVGGTFSPTLFSSAVLHYRNLNSEPSLWHEKENLWK